jgi:hypothetical protein
MRLRGLIARLLAGSVGPRSAHGELLVKGRYPVEEAIQMAWSQLPREARAMLDEESFAQGFLAGRVYGAERARKA